MPQMFAEERGDLSESLLGLGHAIIKLVLRVRLALVNLELGLDPGPAQLAMHPHSLLSSRSRVPVVRIADGKPCMSP